MGDSKSQILNSEATPFEELKKNIYVNMRVATFARVISFNESRGTVNVQPLIKELIRLPSGALEEVGISQILDAPVFFPGMVTFTPQVNDLCLLIHVDRSFQEVVKNYDTGNVETIKQYGQGNSKRKHDLNDVVALVGFLSYKQANEVVF